MSKRPRKAKKVNPPKRLPNLPRPHVLSGPQAVLARWLLAWSRRSWDAMARESQITWRQATRDVPGELEARFGPLLLQDAALVGTSVVSDVCADVTVRLTFRLGGRTKTELRRPRLVYERSPYRTDPLGAWGVNPISALRVAS